MKLRRYILRRLGIMTIQIAGVITLSFFIMRALPGDPVEARLGMMATEESKAMLRERMGLDQSLHIQFVQYIGGLLQGDLGDSWRTGNPVAQDIRERFPTTFELITISMFLALVLGVMVGAYTALHPGGLLDRATLLYALLAGAMPDFYIGLILILVFYVLLRVAPPPMGRIDIALSQPEFITGSYLVDGVLTRNWPVFRSAVAHLVLPVATLTFVYSGSFMKLTRSTLAEILEGDFLHYARLNGLGPGIVRRYALRAALSPVVNLFGMLYAFVLGAAVLVESVFGLAGMGLYSVQSIVGADYEALGGFLLVAAIFYLVMYISVDLVQATLDPRVRF
jgi:peptide/nickel transport system permease protein